MSPRERSRVIRLLVDRTTYCGTTSNPTATLHLNGIKASTEKTRARHILAALGNFADLPEAQADGRVTHPVASIAST